MLKRSLLLVSNASVQLSDRLQCWTRRVVFCAAAFILFGACGRLAVGQTAHFAGAQSVLGSSFAMPHAVASDRNGNVFVADTNDGMVKEIVAVNGSIPASPLIRVLGSGFSLPWSIAVDTSGNVFVADFGNNAIKEIQAVNGSVPDSPVISILFNVSAPVGVALDSAGNVYFTDTENGQIKELLYASGYASVVTLATEFYSGGQWVFMHLSGLAVDSAGDVFASDSADNAIYEIVAVNGSIPPSPLIREVVSGLNNPEGVAVDGNGNIFVADYNNNLVKEALAVNGSIPTSPAVVSIGNGLHYPAGVIPDEKGNVLIADLGNSRVVEAGISGGNFGSIDVGTTSSAVQFTFAFDTAGTLGSIAVLMQGATGLDFADAGSGSCKANTAYSSGQTCTVNVQFTPKFAGTRIGAVVLSDSTGSVIATGYLQGAGAGPQVSFLPGTETVIPGISVSNPHGIAVDGKGNIYVSDDNGVEKETFSNGGYTQSTIAGGSSAFNLLAVDGAGSLYITDINKAVLKETPTASGYSQSVVDSGFGYPYGVAVDGAGNLYIADAWNGQILKETPTAGGYTRSTVVTGLSNCVAVAVDGKGNLYIASDGPNGSGTVLKETLSAGGYTATALPIEGLFIPYSVIVDGIGNVYFADAQTYNVYKETLTPSGYVESAVVTDLHDILGPYGLAVDGSGKMYIAYLGGHSVVLADFADPPSLSFASTPVGSTSADSPQTVTLTNVGNADLIFPIPASGNNPSITSNFTLDENAPSACPVTGSGFGTEGVLAAGSSCEFPISFAPTTVGSLSGSLVLTDNNLNASAPAYSTQTVALNGTGTPPVPAVMVSPTPGGTLAGPITSFTWTAGSAGTPTYYLWVGTSYGTNNLVNWGLHTTSFTATLPTNGALLYVRLWTVINGQFLYNDYTYTESSAGPATMISPTPGSTLTGPGTTFTWTTGPAGTSAYYLWVGTAFGANNLVNMGLHATSLTVTLPTDGAQLYVRLWTVINGVFVYKDYTYTESSAGPAAMVSPTPGTILSGPVTTFTWAPGPAGTTTYYLWVGTAFGTNNLVNMGLHTTSLTVTLPTNGAPLYVRLWTVINGVFVYKDYTYTEFNAGQAIVVAPHSELGLRRDLFLDGA